MLPEQAASSGRERRLAAIVLPELQLMAAGAKRAPPRLSATPPRLRSTIPPTAVVLLPLGREQVEPTDRLSAVGPCAFRLGVRPGQTVTEAGALLAQLRVLPLQADELNQRLLELCEVMQRFGTLVAFELPDTVFLDVSGVGHLFGGEELLAEELAAQASALGHAPLVVIASGPKLAQAVARYGQLSGQGRRIVVAQESAKIMRSLPLLCLLEREQHSWFSRLGVLTVEQLLALPAASLASRLGAAAVQVLELARGEDQTPLTPCTFPRMIELSVDWDEPAAGIEPLRFALRGLVGRLCARLTGRGEAVTRLTLLIQHERSISRFRSAQPEMRLEFELAAPVQRDVELERVLQSRLERTALPAPSIGLQLTASGLTSPLSVQLELSTRGESQRLDELPVLLAELETDVGKENLGLLSIQDAHCPEQRSRLLPIGKHARSPARAASDDPLDRATRILETPVAISVPLRLGESFVLGQGYYTIEKLEFATRLTAVSWWTATSQSRDYVWAWLSGSAGGLEALLYVDRRTQRAFVQALTD